MRDLEPYMDGVTAAMRGRIIRDMMLHRRASEADREHVNGIIDGFAADVLAAAQAIAARCKQPRKASSRIRRAHLRLVIDNTAPAVQP
jgi:hypothetical protein